jgi:hypothetical protein
MNTKTNSEMIGMSPEGSRVVMDINYNYQDLWFTSLLVVFLRSAVRLCWCYWLLFLLYCGVWPIKCRQGSETNKSNCQF